MGFEPTVGLHQLRFSRPSRSFCKPHIYQGFTSKRSCSGSAGEARDPGSPPRTGRNRRRLADLTRAHPGRDHGHDPIRLGEESPSMSQASPIRPEAPPRDRMGANDTVCQSVGRGGEGVGGQRPYLIARELERRYEAEGAEVRRPPPGSYHNATKANGSAWLSKIEPRKPPQIQMNQMAPARGFDFDRCTAGGLSIILAVSRHTYIRCGVCSVARDRPSGHSRPAVSTRKGADRPGRGGNRLSFDRLATNFGPVN